MQPAFVVAILLSGCDAVFDLDHVDPASDAGPDAFGRDPVAGLPFSAPVLISELQTANEEDDPSLTSDLRELYYYSSTNIYLSIRATADAAWSAPSLVMELDSTLTNFRPSVSSDGLTLYFTRRSPAEPRDDIYVATRPSRGVPWGSPMPLPGNVNTNDHEIGGWSSDDGLTLVVESSTVGGQHDLFFATRDDTDAPFTRGPPLDFAN